MYENQSDQANDYTVGICCFSANQNTGRKQTKQKHNTKNKKDEQHRLHQKAGVNPWTCERYAVPPSCTTRIC